MYTKKTKRGSSEKSTLSNQLITARNLRLKIKQLVEKENFFELEPVEVLKVYPTGSADDKGYIDYGRIVGRYVVSEQGLPFEECKDFFPLDTNVLQYPLEGEVVVGFEFNKERYYFATLNRKQNDWNLYKYDFDTNGADLILNDSNDSWIDRDPFVRWKPTYEKRERLFLTDNELSNIEKLPKSIVISIGFCALFSIYLFFDPEIILNIIRLTGIVIWKI